MVMLDTRERTQRFVEVDPATPRKVRRSPALTVLALAIGLLSAGLVLSVLLSPGMQWPVIVSYLFSPAILAGLGVTLAVTVLAMVIALVLGAILALFRVSEHRILSTVAWAYVWFFRSVPTLVLLLIVYNISILLPRIVVGVPFGPEFFSFSTKDLINGFVTGVLVFGLQQAAYTSEIIRSAYLSVSTGQIEASKALGMTPMVYLRKIIAPQAFRVALPPIANDTINLMKSTSLLAFIAVSDLLYATQLIYSRTYQIIPMLMVACLWYVVLVSVLSAGQSLLERFLRTGTIRARTPARTHEPGEGAPA